MIPKTLLSATAAGLLLSAAALAEDVAVPGPGLELGGANTVPGIPVVPGIPIVPGIPVTPGIAVVPGVPVTPGFSVTPGLETTYGRGATTLRDSWAQARRHRPE